MSVEIRLFGAPQILCDGVPLHFDTRKAVALLAYLAVTGTAQRRETLAGLLWPEATNERARATLRRTLSAAARLGPALRTTGPEVALVGTACDVSRFVALASSANPADLQIAVELAQAPFLHGFSLRDSPEFDEWQAATADRLRDQLSSALASLVAHHWAGADEASALRCARRRVALDPLSEPAHRELMVALTRSGDRAAALRQYRTLLRTLDRELGVAPLPQTTQLAADIRSGQTPTIAAAGPASEAPIGAGPPAQRARVGRERLLTDILAAVADGGAFGVTGEPGMGRTTLLAEVGARARGAGMIVLTGTGRSSDRNLPFALAGDLLGPVLRGYAGEAADAFAGLLPEAGDGQISPGAQRRRLSAVLAALQRRALDDPILLIVDDAHLADASSADLIGQLLHRLPPRVALLASWPGHAAAQPLCRAVRDSSPGPIKRLTGLTPEEVAILAGAEDAGNLWERTRGNPRYVLECLSARGDWAADLLGLVADRIEGLSAASRQVLAAAAVLDGPASADLLRKTAGRDELEVVEAIEENLGLGLLVETNSGYVPAHDVARSAVIAATSTARQQLLHRRAAVALGSHPGSPPGLVAHHYLLAGDTQAAADWSWRAAAAALGVRADEEALEHLRHCTPSAAVALATGEVLVRLGRYDAAIVGLESGLVEDTAADEAQCRLHHRLALVHDRLGEFPAAAEHLAAAVAACPPDLPEHGVMLADQALALHRLADHAQAETLARRALANGHPAAGAKARNVLGLLALAEDDAAAGLAYFEEAAEIARAHHLVEIEVAAGQNSTGALRRLGRLDDAMQVVTRTLELADRESDLHRVAAVTSQLADVLHEIGRDDEAAATQAAATEMLSQIALPAQRPGVWLTAAW